MKALHFNPINENEFNFREIESTFKVIDEFYYQTDKGPILMGELWIDTPYNRELIDVAIEQKKALKLIRDNVISSLYMISTKREK